MARVDLNSDLGESFGRYSLGLDDQVIPLVTSVNIACGMHGATRASCVAPLPPQRPPAPRLAHTRDIPTLQGFGRRDMALSPMKPTIRAVSNLGACRFLQSGRHCARPRETARAALQSCRERRRPRQGNRRRSARF